MNSWYPKWKEARLQSTAGAALDGDVRAVLLNATYDYGVADEFLADVPVGARVAVSTPLQNKTYDSGLFDADDIVITAVPPGLAIRALALFVDSGDPDTSRLVMYVDSVNGLPVTSDGADIAIHWNELGIAIL